MLNTFFHIRKFISLALIFLFLFGITPITLLHSLVANHTDVCYHHFDKKEKHFSKADINCHTISFVAEAQFASHSQPIIIASPEKALRWCNFFYSENFYLQHHFFAGLRGPPSLA